MSTTRHNLKVEQNKTSNGEWRMAEETNSIPITSESKEKRNEESFDTWCFGLRIFCWCGQTPKGLQSFFLWADIPDSSYHWHLSNIHWWKCLNSLNLKEFNHCRNIRIQRWFSSVRSQYGPRLEHIPIKRFTQMSCQFWMKKKNKWEEI